jgi:hypothetical protein
MAKSKPVAAKTAGAEDVFTNLMMVAADFVKNCGGIEPAKKFLAESARFIEQAGSAAKATRALEVLESIKAKI